MTSDRKIPLAILLCSSASLAYEVALTRIFSISLWYHYAFMIIGIAMLGFAASGTALALQPRLREMGKLGPYALLLGIAIPASYLLANQVPFDPVRLSWEKSQFFHLALYYLILALPFFCTGLVVATAFAVQSGRSGLFYGADLLGAGLGSMGVLFLLGVAAPERAVFVIAAAPLAAAWALGGTGIRSFTLLLIGLDLLLFLSPPGFAELRISPYKGLKAALRYPGAALLKTYHTPFARIDTFESPAVRFAPGLSLGYLDPLPRQIGLATDAGEISAVTAAGDPASLAFLDYLPSALPYYIGGRERVLTIDPQGGLQALVARRFGAEYLVKAETDPAIVAVIRRDWGEFSGNIYDGRTVTGLARSWLAGTGDKFDIIDISLQGTEPYGSFGIAEEYRFTVEAFTEYLRHLEGDGMLAVNLYIIPPPRTEFRLLATMAQALAELGVAEPARHMAAVRSWGSLCILAKRSPLTAADTEGIRRFARERRFDPLWFPGLTAAEASVYVKSRGTDYFRAFAAILDPAQRERFLADYLFDVAPVRDDRPFFRYFLKLPRSAEIYRIMGGKWQFFLEEGYIVPAVLVQVAVLGLPLLLLPLLAGRRERNSGAPGRRLLPSFALLGLGFMLVETALIQKIILPLEHPSYAVATALASLLVSSGIGSLMSSRFAPLRSHLVPAAIALLIVIYSFTLPALSAAIAPAALPAKVLLVFLALLPLGLLMGIPFPVVIQRLGLVDPLLIPSAWAINGTLSVLAPLLAIMTATAFGFVSVFWVGASCYLLVCLNLRAFARGNGH
ncbi:MAG: hypothetical protein NDI77_16770 [Geobacteraceae bacterium]|nr:hypothetical protein [Geobacteraceae bacterium]